MQKTGIKPLDINVLVGDSTKAKEKLNWKPNTDFETLVKIMVDTDYNNWKNYLDGKTFPWDAPNFPSEKQMLTRAIKL